MQTSDYHIAVARHLRVHAVADRRDVRYHTAQSSGYGHSSLEARVRAAYEAVERYCTLWQGDEHCERGTLAAMGPEVISPNDIMLFSEKQFRERDATNAALQHPAEYVPEPLDPHREIDWSRGWCPLTRTMKWIPAALTWDGYPQENRVYGLADSNGVAAGPDPHFAARNGLFELIERHCFSVFHYNRLKKRGVDLASWENPYFDQVLAYHEFSLRRRLVVLDLRPNCPGRRPSFYPYLPLYVFAAFSWNPKTDTVVPGFGAHPEAGQAIRGALEECNQMLPNVMPPAGPERTWGLAMQDHLHPDTSCPALKREDYSPAPSVASLRSLLAALAERDIPVVLQNLTRRETGGLPVVRVLAPGLRPWWRRTAPGLLYNAPVETGERDRPLHEEALNPIPVTF